MKHFARQLALTSARSPWITLGITLVLSGWALMSAIQLPVYTSRQALLPQDTEVAKRLEQFLQQFGAASDLVVVLEMPQGAISRPLRVPWRSDYDNSLKSHRPPNDWTVSSFLITPI